MIVSRLNYFLYLLLMIAPLYALADSPPSPPVLSASTRAAASVIDFDMWKSRILPDEKIGTLVAFSHASELRYDEEINNNLAITLTTVFSDLAGKQGYTVKKDSSNDQSMNVTERISEPDYRIAASLVAMEMDVRYHWPDLMSGKVRCKIKWEVFSEIEQAVVYDKTLEAAADVDANNPIRANEFYAKAMRASAIIPLADPAFLSAIEGTIAQIAPQEPIRLHATALPKAQFAGELKTLTASTVTIKTKGHSGSGFYVSDDGYLLTNWHVVQNARYVRIINADGRQLIGEVLRSNPGRDVALIKTETSPQILPINLSAPAEGTQVYAVGSPYGEKFTGTISRGILSSPRVMKGRKYLQSDAAISPGNSGGPLVDSKGQVIGICVLGYVYEKGLNFFIPIDEALNSVALEVR